MSGMGGWMGGMQNHAMHNSVMHNSVMHNHAMAAAMAVTGGLGVMPALSPVSLEGVVTISDPPPVDPSNTKMVCQVGF